MKATPRAVCIHPFQAGDVGYLWEILCRLAAIPRTYHPVFDRALEPILAAWLKVGGKAMSSTPAGGVVQQAMERLRTLPVDWDKVCAYCATPATQATSWCPACLGVRYCDRTCQKHDWKRHKLLCPDIRELKARQPKEVPSSWLEHQPPFPDEASGFLSLIFPCGGEKAEDRFNFCRRTNDQGTQRFVVSASMRLLPRCEWMTLLHEQVDFFNYLWNLVFVRFGVVAAGPHDAGTHEGLPVLHLRPLRVNLSRARHLRICLELAHLGLGLITGHRNGGQDKVFRAHSWPHLRRDLLGRDFRKGICFMGFAKLLPKGVEEFYSFLEAHVPTAALNDADESDAFEADD